MGRIANNHFSSSVVIKTYNINAQPIRFKNKEVQLKKGTSYVSLGRRD